MTFTKTTDYDLSKSSDPIVPSYTPIVKPNQLIMGTGNVIIVTGWTVKKTVAKKLDPSEYAAIGNLYCSMRGISFLLRNLLANPSYNRILILDLTKEDWAVGSCRCLMDFFLYGVTSKEGENHIINSEVNGRVDKEIPLSALEELRRTIVTPSFCSTNPSQKHVVKSLNYIQVAKQLNEGLLNPFPHPPQIFPMPKIDNKVTPGHRYGHRIEGKTIAETWVKIIHRIRTTGTIRPTGYDGKWQELIDLTAIITDEPDGFYFPEPNYLPCNPESIKKYIPQVLEDAPYKEGVKYTYGQRLRSWFGRDQISDVIAKLVKEIDSASAVMCLWDSGSGTWENLTYDPNNESLLNPAAERFGRQAGDSDHQHGGSPCLNHIWTRVVNGELSMTALFRSNDMFAAWPSNAMGLRALQKHIFEQVKHCLAIAENPTALTLGPLITISQSAHIYDDCWQDASKLIQGEYERIIKREQKVYDDPAGNFVVFSEDGINLKVEHLNLEGELIQVFEGRMPQNIINEIERKVPGIQPSHMGYIALQLAQVKTSKDQVKQDNRKSKRPNYETFHDYVMAIAHTVATASTCKAQQVGAVIVSDDENIVATGYNKTPRDCYNLDSCYDGTTSCMESSNPSMAVHAEISAIVTAATEGVSIKGCSIYVTKVPCINCLKAITASGMTALYLPEEHSGDLPKPDDYSMEVFAYKQYLELVPVHFV